MQGKTEHQTQKKATCDKDIFERVKEVLNKRIGYKNNGGRK